MPLKIPDQLPAIKILEEENIFVMNETRASHQDIRPLKIIILNLMPIKITTETDLIRLLSNTPLQLEVLFMKLKRAKNGSFGKFLWQNMLIIPLFLWHYCVQRLWKPEEQAHKRLRYCHWTTSSSLVRLCPIAMMRLKSAMPVFSCALASDGLNHSRAAVGAWLKSRHNRRKRRSSSSQQFSI